MLIQILFELFLGMDWDIATGLGQMVDRIHLHA